MTIRLNNVAQKATFKGTGATYRIDQYRNDTYLKTLVASVQTSAGNDVVVDFNTGSPASNLYDIGDDNYIYAIDTNEPVGNAPLSYPANKITLFPFSPFKIVDSNAQDGRPLAWNAGSFWITAADRCYQVDEVDGRAAVLYGIDPVAATVNKVLGRYPLATLPKWSVLANSTAAQPVYDYDFDLNIPYISFGHFGGHNARLNFSLPAAQTNPSFIELLICVRPNPTIYTSGTAYVYNGFVGQIEGQNIRVTDKQVAIGSVSHNITPNLDRTKFHLVRFKIPKNASFNGGKTEIYINETKVAEDVFTLGTIQTMFWRNVPEYSAHLTSMLLHIGELTGSYLTNAVQDSTHTAKLTIS